MLEVRWLSLVLADMVIWYKLLITHMTLPLTSPHFGGIHLALPPKVLINGHDVFARMSPSKVRQISRLSFWPCYLSALDKLCALTFCQDSKESTFDTCPRLAVAITFWPVKIF